MVLRVSKIGQVGKLVFGQGFAEAHAVLERVRAHAVGAGSGLGGDGGTDVVLAQCADVEATSFDGSFHLLQASIVADAGNNHADWRVAKVALEIMNHAHQGGVFKGASGRNNPAVLKRENRTDVEPVAQPGAAAGGEFGVFEIMQVAHGHA